MKDWSTVAHVDVSYADYRKGRLVKRFDSVDDAVRWIGFDKVMKLRGCYFHVGRTWDERNWTIGFGDEFELRDDLGLRIAIDFLKHRAEIVCKQKKKIRYKRYYGRFVYRDGPVEGIHRRHSWRGGGRHLRTTQERRESDFLQYDEDLYDVTIKYRRKGELPTRWDDIPSTRHARQNWKRYRKTQYKVVAKATT